MEKINSIGKDKTLQNMMIGIMLVLGLIWTNTFIHQNSFSEGLDSFVFLKRFVVVAFYTLLYYCILNWEPADEPFRRTKKLCAIGMAVSGVLMLFALLLELGTDGFSLYGEKDIVFWWLSIPKKYAFDFWAIIVFPTNISIIFKAMRKEDYDFQALLYGGLTVIGLTLEGGLIFRPMSNIWLVDLMVLHTFTIALAVWKYALSEKGVRKGNAIAAIILYGLMCIFFLVLMCVPGNGTIFSLMYAGDWSDLMSGTREIIANASLFGTSDYLLNSEHIHSWLVDRNRPILHLLYYGGWAAVIGLIIFLICFVIIIVKLLGINNGREHRNWLVFGTSVAMLSIRTIMGLLYSFGFPYPIALPFLGTGGSIMDSMAFALLLIGAWENHRINQFLQIKSTFVSSGEIIGTQDEVYIVDDCGEPYVEEFYEDEVDIIVKDGDIHCKADWYMVDEREFCVFEKQSVEEGGTQRFILEYADEQWKRLEGSENDLIEKIIEKYIRNYRPDCMVSEGGVDDEEDYWED